MKTNLVKLINSLKGLLTIVLIAGAALPAFGSSTPKFYAKATSDSPSGAGYIYAYRGGGDYKNGANGENDKLTKPQAGDWVAVGNKVTVTEMEIKLQEGSPTGNTEPDGYRIMDKRNQNDAGETQYVLHLYFFAKPNPGYQFDGWFHDDGTEYLGSRDHYPMPGRNGCAGVSKENRGPLSGTYTPSTWDNGEGLTEANGYYAAGGFYYLRDAVIIPAGEGTTEHNVYAKFSIAKRTFTLAKTGHDAVTYTATGYSGTIANDEPKTTSEINSNISLAINIPDPEKYTFEGWYWSDGKDGAQTLISESPSATFSWTGNSDIVAKMNTVWIWPKVTKIVNNVAEVTYNEVTTPYESWDDALTAAKAVSGATITLNKSVSDLSAVQTINKSMTINLNGNTLSGTANNFFTITGSGVEVTITDNSSQGNGRIDLANSTDAETYAVSVRSGAKLTISGGTICNVNASNASGTARGVEAQSGTTIIVTGGHIEGQSLKNAYALINRGTATISGGDMYAHTTSGAYNVGTAVAFYNVGTTNTITGGTFRAYSYTNKAYGIQQNVNNTLTINDATVRTETRGKSRNSKDDDDIYIGGQSYALYYSQGKIIVNGGKYYAINQGNTSQKQKRDAHYAVAPVNVANNAQVTIYGGVYLTHHNLAACAASGYVRTDLLYEDPDYTAGYRYTVVNSSTEPYVCKVLTTLDVIYYKTLEEAFAYVNEHSTQDLTIVITSTNCTLSAGTYTVPSSVKLLLPFDVEGTISMGENMDENPIYYNYNATRTRECYSKLTLESGVNLKIYGKLNVNALLHNRAGGSMVANVLDNYGRIHMNEGSHIDLESGSACTVWGFITGGGTITAKSGSMVREAFQFDFRGGTHISNTYTTAFPMCQYYVQNIEAPITFNYGATENVFTCCYANYDDRRGAASFIGSEGMFRLVSGSTLTRHYVGSEDRIYYDLYGNASIQDITVDVEIAEMASKDYILPINNNMTLRIHSGTTTIYYDLSLLPDSRVVIDEGATVEIKQNFYIYDRSDWRADETGYTYQDSNDKTQKSYFAVSGDLNLLPFSPTKTFTRTSAGLTDAHVIVNGTLKTLSTKGKLYTTTHGADITSEGSGKVILGVAAGANTSFKQGISTASKTQAIPVTAAQLHNGNDTYIATSGAAANAMYQYCDGTWTPGGCINYYTITWKSEDGNTTLETDADVAEGTATSFDKADPTKTSTAEYTFTFDGWTTAANGGGDFYAKGATPAASADATYYAHFSQAPVSYTLSWVTDGDALTGDYTHGSVAYGATIVAPSTPTKTGYTFNGWSPAVAATMPAANTTYTATWTPVNYTIGYTLNGGSVDPANPTSYTIESEAITLTNPTKSGYTFDGWTGTGLSGATATVTIAAGSTGDRSYTATWHIASSDVLEVGETHEKQITINSNETVSTTIVHADGKLDVSAGTLTTTDLILEASESASGQIIGADKITLTSDIGNAYFDLSYEGGFKARTWYAVAVPWEVFVPTGALGGVYLKKGELEPVQQTLGTTFDLIFYDGERRATTGENKAWTYVEDYYAAHTEKYPVMEPGVAYMIYLTSDADVIRFRKSDADLTLYHISTQVTKHDSPKTADEHWNGIANPATYHARIDLSSAGVGFGQVYSDPINQLYSVFDLSKKLVVGQPVFVQVPLTSAVGVSAPSSARRRAKEQVSITRYDLMLAASDADVTDRVIVRMDEEKTENEYVIGQDLVKMGVSNKAPQMWIDRYGEKMCVNTVAGFDNTADYPLGIFAPKNGEYDLFIDDQPNDETMLYLTYDGEAIWNLSYGGYVASLDKGTNTHYGLRIAKKAPQITTGIEETTIQNGEAVRKVLVNDKVYIIRNGEIYSVTGQKAK